MPSSAVYTLILEAVQTTIQGLDLTDIADANVQLGKVFPESPGCVPGLPGILLLPVREGGNSGAAGTNASDDIEYQVAVWIFAADCPGAGINTQTQNLDRGLYWRELIRKAFINQRLSGAPTVWTCRVDHTSVTDRPAWIKDNTWIGGLILRFISRERRS